MAKPVVDGIEREVTDARFYRLNTMSRTGMQLARAYGARGLPTLLVLDGQGETVLRQVGRVDKEAVLQAVSGLGS